MSLPTFVITAKVGPDKTMTAQNFTNVRQAHFDFQARNLVWQTDDGIWHECTLTAIVGLVTAVAANYVTTMTLT